MVFHKLRILHTRFPLWNYCMFIPVLFTTNQKCCFLKEGVAHERSHAAAGISRRRKIGERPLETDHQPHSPHLCPTEEMEESGAKELFLLFLSQCPVEERERVSSWMGIWLLDKFSPLHLNKYYAEFIWIDLYLLYSSCLGAEAQSITFWQSWIENVFLSSVSSYHSEKNLSLKYQLRYRNRKQKEH